MCGYFEKKVKESFCKFDLLDKIAKKQEVASDYYAWVREGYKTYFEKVDSVSKSKFYIRYYRAKKLIYSSAQMLMEAKCSLENECVIGYYYLIYYALFQAMQANLIFCIRYDNNKVIQLSHENVKVYFDEQFCKNGKCPLNNEIITLIEDLRSYREYYSYAMPFNLSEKAIIDISKVEYYISVCCQLFNLHCFIVWQDIGKSFKFDSICEDEIKKYLQCTCNRLGYDEFTDDADKNFWHEYKNMEGGEILPLSISFSHDFDEFRTYDSKVYETLGMPRTQQLVSKALKFLYDVVGGL